MKRTIFMGRIAILMAVLSILIPGCSTANDPVVVIVNRNNPVEKLSENSLKKIYTNNVLTWPNGMPIIIYDLTIRDPLREVFSERILGRSSRSIAEHWAHLKITNQAKNPPRTVKDQSYMIRKVEHDRGAIGYVSMSSVMDNPNIKIVRTIE
ncbi:MAG TPA: substrate-binding domain-containing protein [Thermodesulfobacteriota bacterium]|nr:substrate-binding domain-containing protein [Thermodesulfobacteriota bacterium]